MEDKKIISIITPVYNEEKNIPIFYAELQKVVNSMDKYDFELIFVNDGSRDKSLEELRKMEKEDERVMVIDLSRNFGKEIATTAGINHCRGEACIMLDSDLQHPVEKIPEFVSKWENGAEVVIGVRKKNNGEGLVKKMGSFFFYKIINRISDTKVMSNATDYRLLDRMVINEFNKLTEKNRMTRALIDWLGFKREYIYFEARPRIHGEAGYSFWKLMRLAFNSMISLSIFPLRIAGYLGIIITIFSGVLGLFIFITNYVTESLDFSGPAILAVVILFLIGIVLICLGLIALYIANIHSEVNNRPLYVVRRSRK
ncbi:MAG TPA: glycosyltransferase family 2 protein [Candidatus Moranbacteria bacterium]|nr:glycosyltransferase family 2 protein [Candidatus Moranbacteria bacterium]